MTAATTVLSPTEVTDAQRVDDATSIIDGYLSAVGAIDVVQRFLPRVPGAASGVSLNVPRPDEHLVEKQDAISDRYIEDVVERFKVIEDVVERVVQTQTLIGLIDEAAKPIRYNRDVGLLVMLAPWYKAQREFKEAKIRLAANLANGSITREEYDAQLEAVEVAKRDAGSMAKWKPSPACRLARVSRSLLANRIKPREPLPRPDLPLAQAEGYAERSGRDVHYLDKLRDAVEVVRNEAIDVILAGPPEGLGWQNAQLSRTLGKTTARIAQIRRGTR